MQLVKVPLEVEVLRDAWSGVRFNSYVWKGMDWRRVRSNTVHFLHHFSNQKDILFIRLMVDSTEVSCVNRIHKLI